jgi:hypothetical protein
MTIITKVRRRLSTQGPKRTEAVSVPVRTIFRDQAHNVTLARDGVVTFPWLSQAQIGELSRIVASVSKGVDFEDVHIPTNFRLSAFTNDTRYKSRLYEAVNEYMTDFLEDLLPGYLPLVINVFEKLPESGPTQVAIHQNPSFVKEPEHKSLSIWIPLRDVTRKDGTVGVLRGSHERFNRMRAGNMDHLSIFELVAQQLQKKYFEPLDLKAGEIAILDDSIVHWSYPNESDSARIAVQLIMVPRAAEHIYFYYDQSGPTPTMELYKVDKHFFFDFNYKDRPERLTKITSVPYRYEKVTERELFNSAREPW